MDEVHAFCLRMLGPGEAADAAEQAARAAADGDDRVSLLAAAAAECRTREQTAPAAPAASHGPVRAVNPGSVGGERGAEPATDDPAGPTEPQPEDDPRTGDPGHSDPGHGDPAGLAEAVAEELAEATAGLPQRQREALALRELIGLAHAEVASVVGVDHVAVAPLLARARLRLRTALRGEGQAVPECAERERGLRTMTLRQDHEDVSSADEDWLIEHLGHCLGCAHAHAAMLEASACYRAWRPPETIDTAATTPMATGA